jgi:membrane protein implicated in regulation of membrane protease activity
MTAEFIDAYAWIFWLGLILVFVIVEVLTVDFTFLMLALGSVGGLLAGVAGAEWWLQVLVAAVLSVLLLFAVRPPLLRALKRGGDPTLSNVDALLGLTGVVVNDFAGNAGHVKLANGETWTARLSETVLPRSADAKSSHSSHALPGPTSARVLEEGDLVVVTAIDGATAVVVPTERTTP